MTRSTTRLEPNPRAGRGFETDEIREFTRVAGRLATEARERANKRNTVKICGSLPPLTPSYRSDRTIDKTKGQATYLLIAEALWPFVDIYLVESMSSLAEAQLAYRSVHHLRKPVLVAFALNSTGEQLRSGEDVVNAIQRLVECADSIAQEEGSEVMLHGVLFNCSQPEDIAKGLHYVHRSETLQNLFSGRSIVLGAYGDRISTSSTAGKMEETLVSGAMHSALDMEIYREFVLRWIQCGALLVGGCCGIPPSYIEYIAQVVDQESAFHP
ncbi:hypothetical protein PINS_up021650 [Pythium insidiosum]|nr:hypothetical protein PINS_up021650 [Pythium insidiosum]